MDNEILGHVIIKVKKITRKINNDKYGLGEICLKKYHDKFMVPTEKEFGKEYEAYIAANNTEFERNKYYLCAYYENKRNDVNQKIYINNFIEQIQPIEITEDEEEYLKKQDIYWDDIDNKIIYKPKNMSADKYCVEGWDNSVIYKYTINEDNKLYILTMPSEKPDRYKDYLIEDKNENKLNEWIIEEIKSYNKEIQNEIEQILRNNIDENIYALRWKKGLEHFRNNILMKSDERKDEIIKIIDEYYYKKSEDIDREIKEKYESMKTKDNLIKLLDSDIKYKQQEKEKIEQNIKRLQTIKIELKKEINEKEEEKNTILDNVNQEREKLEKENSDLWQKNIELKANLEQQQVDYLLRKKENLINISIEHKDNSNEPQQENLNKKVIQKYDKMAKLIEQINGIKHDELIIYPNPKWISFDDLWNSGFGAIFEMAHQNKEQLYVVIIQNYNLSPCELWSMPLVNLIQGYTNKLPYTQNIGYPKNLWIYFIESELEEISFPVSESFNGIFND